MTRPPNLTAVPEAARRPLTETETGIFVHCELLLKEKAEPVTADKLPEAIRALGVFTEKFDSSFVPQVLLTRLRAAPKDTLFDPCMVALACVMPDRAGIAVMWAWTLFERGRELGRPYTISDFTDDFPMGPPTAEGSHPVWDAQKGDGDSMIFPTMKTDNLLDIAETWKTEGETADA